MKIRTRTGLPEPHADMAPLISSYQDGLATPDEADLVERHLLECDLCRSFYGGLQDVRGLIADLPSDVNRHRVEDAYEAVMDKTIRGGRPKWKRPGGRRKK